MTILEALYAAEKIFIHKGIPDPRLDAEYLLAHVLSLPRLAMRLQGREPLFVKAEEDFFRLVQLRSQREPLQYLLGTQDFMGHTFLVDSRVLIPRPETELLCEKVIASLAAFPAPQQVLDLCCGSGALGISIALAAASAEVEAADLSKDALTLAKQNAEALHAPVTFYQGDFLSAVKGHRYHLIVCNPPYIPKADCQQLQPEVMLEPKMALDGGDDGLTFYRLLAKEAPMHLHPGGQVWMEVGYNQAHTVAELFKASFASHTEIFQDYSGIHRMVLAQ